MTQQGFFDIRIVQELIFDGVLVVNFEVGFEVVTTIIGFRDNKSFGGFVVIIKLFILDIFHIGYDRFRIKAMFLCRPDLPFRKLLTLYPQRRVIFDRQIP